MCSKVNKTYVYCICFTWRLTNEVFWGDSWFICCSDCSPYTWLHCTLTLAHIFNTLIHIKCFVELTTLSSWLKCMYVSLFFLIKCTPKSELLSHSHDLCHSSTATKLRPPPTGSHGFNNSVRSRVHMTAFTLTFFNAKTVPCFKLNRQYESPSTLNTALMWSTEHFGISWTYKTLEAQNPCF